MSDNAAGWKFLTATSGADGLSVGKWLMGFGLFLYLAIQPVTIINILMLIGGWLGFSQDASKFSSAFEGIALVLIIAGFILLIWGFISSRWKKSARAVVLGTYDPLDVGAIIRLINQHNSFWVKLLKMNFEFADNPIKIQKIMNSLNKKSERIRGREETFFVSIAHIPFVSLFGFLTRNYHFEFLEINHASKQPYLLSDNPSKNRLQFNIVQDPIKMDTREIAISISLSRKIDKDTVLRSIAIDIPVIEIENSSIQEMPYTSKIELDQAVLDVRNAFLQFTQTNKSIKNVHVFYAGPTSFIFSFSKLINKNTDPVVTIYNYTRGKGYNWGIKLEGKGKYVQL